MNVDPPGGLTNAALDEQPVKNPYVSPTDFPQNTVAVAV